MEIKTFSKEDDVYTIYCNNIDTKEGVEVAINNIMAAIADYMITADEYDFFEQEFIVDGKLIDSYEECIWEKLAAQKDSYEIIEKYLTYAEHIMKISSSEIWEDDECPLAEKATLYAALNNKRFIPFYTRFLQIWDMGHEVYQEEDIDAIIEKHGWCLEVEDLIVSRANCNGQHDECCLETHEDFIYENNKDFINSDFFAKFIIARHEESGTTIDWNDCLSFSFLEDLRDSVDAKILEILKQEESDDAQVEYKVVSSGNNSGYFMLLEEIENYDYKCYWTIAFADNCDNLVFSEIHKDRLYVFTEMGKLSIYDISKKELFCELNIENSCFHSAKISKSRNALIISLSNSSRGCDNLSLFDLDDLSVIASYVLPENSTSRGIDFGVNGEILFYYSETSKEDFSHGYNVLNEKSGELVKREMTNPPRCIDSNYKPYIDQDKGLAIMPSWEDIEFNCDENGKKTAPFSLRIFELVNFKEVSLIKTIDFPILDILYSNEKAEHAESLIKDISKDSKEYFELLENFYGCLNTVLFTDDISFTVCFRGGLIVEVGYNKECSAILMPSGVDSFPDVEYYPHFDFELISMDDDEAVVRYANDYYSVDIPGIELYFSDKIVRKRFKAIPSDNITISDEDKELINSIEISLVEVERYKREDDKYIIFCENLDTKEGLEILIETLKEVLSDFIEKGYAQNYCHFDFVFSVKGEILDENELKIWELLASREDMHEVLLGYFNYTFISDLKYGNIWESEEYGLAENAIYKCALTDKKFVDYYSRMLLVWDMGHEVNQYDEVVDIIKKYGWCTEVEDLIINRVNCCGQHDSEFMNEYVDFILENNPDLENSNFFIKLVDFIYKDFDTHAKWERDAEYHLSKEFLAPAIKRMRAIFNPVKDIEISDVVVTVHEAGFQYIKLSRKKEGEDNVYETFWTIELKGDTGRIVLSEVYKGKLYIVNWDAWLRVYDIETKELIHDRKFGGHISSSAKIAKRRNALIIVYYSEIYGCDYINIVDLNNLYDVKSDFSTDNYCGDSFTLGVDDQILFYYSEQDFDTEEWEHGYKLVDDKTWYVKDFKLDNPQRKDYDVEAPFANTNKGIAVCPSWDKLEINISDNGQKTVPFYVRLIDLYSFKELASFKLIDFPVFDMLYNQDDVKELEETILEADLDSDEYKEVLQDFMENLNNVIFDENTDSMWFSFRGGFIVNMDYEGNCSAVINPASKDDSSKAKFDNYFHFELMYVDESGAVLSEYTNLYRMKFTRDEIFSGEKNIIKPLIPLPDTKFLISKEDADLISNIGKFLVEVDDLTKDECLLEALQTISFNIRNYKDISAGSNLIIRLKDKSGNYLEEKEFFEKTVKIEDGRPMVFEIIRSFIPQDGSDSLYYDSETTALAHAMYALVMNSSWFLPLALEYIANVDFEHDVFNREILIPDILSAYPDSPITKEIEEYEESCY
ncbi:MAG: hypothetical protein WBG43_00980 [Marinifilaceae bacterium]